MDDTYLLEGEFAFKSYIPEKLEVGMTFLSSIFVGIMEPKHYFFTLQNVPEEGELFMALYGAPVHLLIVSTDGEEILANSEEIGWFDGGPITDDVINHLINEHNGRMDIECNEEGEILLIDGKVTISYLCEYTE